MKNLKTSYYNPSFRHIYVENAIAGHPETARILSRFPGAQIVPVDGYKAIFNRRGQNPALQHQAQALILARKESPYFYEGAPVCQDFGNANFFYCSLMRGCVYDCSYCYLKGMYPSGHMVIFVNLEDYFAELERMLGERDIYLCISYDADLLAMEAVTGYVGRWTEFAGKHQNLTIEIRTKCARPSMWDAFACLPNVIYAFTLSPQAAIDKYEEKTPRAQERIACALDGLCRGYPVRFCFDPMMFLPDWKREYGVLLDEMDCAFARHGLAWDALRDVSAGCFRISQEYLKAMRRAQPRSEAAWFPYVNVDGVYRYPPKLQREMESYLREELEKRIGRERIYHE